MANAAIIIASNRMRARIVRAYRGLTETSTSSTAHCKRPPTLPTLPTHAALTREHPRPEPGHPEIGVRKKSSRRVQVATPAGRRHRQLARMGRNVNAVPNDDPERLARVLNAKLRTIGVHWPAVPLFFLPRAHA